MASQSLKRCPDCGEAYSSSYKRCPFCEEDAAWQEGEYIRRSGRSRGKKHHSSSFSLVTPTLIILILLMSALLVYLLFGDQIMAKLKGEDLPEPPAASSQFDPPPAASTIEPVAPSVSTQDPPAASTEDPVTDPAPAEIPYETIYALPTALSLNKSGTRREDLLMDQEELEAIWAMRRALSGGSPQEAAEQIIDNLARTKTNKDFLQVIKKVLLDN